MIADALDGEIDIILVKSISRFARNVVDAQRYVHELKAHEVEVRFERESISSFDPSSDMIFNLHAAAAQEESRSISENTKWSYRRNAERGIRHLGNNRVLGYDEVHGDLKPNSDAWIVKMIFNDYAQGRSIKQILSRLNDTGAQRLRSAKTFSVDTILRILENEIYVGDRLIQKQAPVNFLTKRPDPTAAFEQYYISDDHKGIIDRDAWDRVQERREKERELRSIGVYRRSNTHFLHGVVFCAKCGAPYRRRTLLDRDGVPYKTWSCSECRKGKNGNGCKNHGIKEQKLLQEIFKQLDWEWLDAEHINADKILRVVKRVEVANKGVCITMS
ncbi:MAG: recombinase family protein [Syntrophomonadaceae bacterium]|nr:recombinase family protein [Syntrophomonadaceae bacterium]